MVPHDLIGVIDRQVQEGKRTPQNARLTKTALRTFLSHMKQDATLDDLSALLESGQVVGRVPSYETYRSRVRTLLASLENRTEPGPPRRQVLVNPDEFTRIPFPLPSGSAYLIMPTTRDPQNFRALADQLEAYAAFLRIQTRKDSPTPTEEDA